MDGRLQHELALGIAQLSITKPTVGTVFHLKGCIDDFLYTYFFTKIAYRTRAWTAVRHDAKRPYRFEECIGEFDTFKLTSSRIKATSATVTLRSARSVTI